MNKIISIDVESNGLRGAPFCFAAIVYDNEIEVDRICLRLPNKEVSNNWVIENVLPAIKAIPITHDSYNDFIESIAEFYLKYKDCLVVWHMGHVVESNLFNEMFLLNYIGEYDSPYTPIELSTCLGLLGYKPDSIEDYAKKNGIYAIGKPHNPLFDCELAAKVYFHIKSRLWHLP